MNFTPQEQRMVEGLRKRQMEWLKWRRWQLLVGIGEMACCFWIFSQIQGEAAQSGTPDFFLTFFTVFYPIAIMIGVAGAIHTGVVVRDWHGNVQSTLLLKLIDRCDSENESSKQS